MGSDAGPKDPIYHYHSNYDSYHWMTTFGDPGFLTHKNMGQYLSLLAYHLASEDLVPLSPVNYATQMDLYYTELRGVIANATQDVDTSELREAIDTFRGQAQEVVALQKLAVGMGDEALVGVVNGKLRDFQRGFTSQGGLPGREFYQHVVFAPGLDTGEYCVDWRSFYRWTMLMMCRICAGHFPRSHGGDDGRQLQRSRRVGCKDCERNPACWGHLEDLKGLLIKGVMYTIEDLA